MLVVRGDHGDGMVRLVGPNWPVCTVRPGCCSLAGTAVRGHRVTDQDLSPDQSPVTDRTPETMPESFPHLLAAARQGDEAAFTGLFRSVQPVLLRFLRTLGGDLAEDVAADTWVSVVRGLHRFQGDESGFRAWVFTIARARLVDARRTAVRVPVPVDAHAVLAGRPASHDVPAAVDELMSTEAALAFIGRLPSDQAEAVLLRHIVGLDATEAARVLGKRPGAVRIATMRGLQRLRQLLPEPTAPPASEAETARGVTPRAGRPVRRAT